MKRLNRDFVTACTAYALIWLLYHAVVLTQRLVYWMRGIKYPHILRRTAVEAGMDKSVARRWVKRAL